MLTMSSIRSALALACLLALAALPARAEEPILIRFSHVVGEKTPKGLGAEMIKQKLEERLPGRVRVEVYPLSRKFTDEEVLMALLFGDVELAAPSTVIFRSFSPSMQVFELPFLFRDVDHIDRFENSAAGQKLLESMLPRGIRGLAWWHNGMRVISADKPLLRPADAEGLTFRIEGSAIFQEQYQRIGVVGIQMPFARVTDAIREGLVKGQENSWSNITSRGIEQLHKNFTVLDHSFLGYMLVTSTAFWDRLPADVRPVLQQIVDEVTVEVNRIARRAAEEDRRRVEQTPGVAIHTPQGADLQLWRDAFIPVWEKFEPQIGADVVAAAVASAPR